MTRSRTPQLRGGGAAVVIFLWALVSCTASPGSSGSSGPSAMGPSAMGPSATSHSSSPGASSLSSTPGASASGSASGSSAPAPSASAGGGSSTTLTPRRVTAPANARVIVKGPVYDAPGATVQLVLTAAGATARQQVSFDGADCSGDVWHHSRGTSQRCWLTLSRTPGRHAYPLTADVLDRAAGTAYHLTYRLEMPGTGPVTSPVSPTVRDTIERCGNTSAQVWLTFDDRFLSDRSRDRLLATLRTADARAIFFFNGNWALSHPQSLDVVRAAGHRIGNHTYSHQSLNAVSDATLAREISRAAPSTAPALVRPGFGAGAYTTRVVDAARKLGYGVCHWTADSGDWRGSTAESMLSKLLDGDELTPPVRPGGVVLMHMTGRHTAELVPALVSGLRAKGIEVSRLP